MSDQTIKLELTIDEVNLILDALGDQPFKAVYALVSRLQAQARSQLAANDGTGAEASVEVSAESLPALADEGEAPAAAGFAAEEP